MLKYQDVYPTPPLLSSLNNGHAQGPSARELLTLEYFEAVSGEMPVEVFVQHHVLLNYRDDPHWVENERDGVVRRFEYHKDEIVITPAGTRSGWKWHGTSQVIVITLDPEKIERFAQFELGVVLSDTQLLSRPQFRDSDLCETAWQLKLALLSEDVGSDLMFEALARIFLIKLIRAHGEKSSGNLDFSGQFTAQHYKKVLDFISEHYQDRIDVESLAKLVHMSPSHFSRLFKQATSQSPYQFLLAYRLERSLDFLKLSDCTVTDVALRCGFSDQAHFSRSFRMAYDQSPSDFRRQYLPSFAKR